MSFLDVLTGIGALQLSDMQDWKKGMIPYLEKVIQGSLGKIGCAMKCFRAWACRKGLKPSYTAYLAKTKGSKKELQFSKSADVKIEIAYCTHYVFLILAERKKERLQED